MEAKLNDFEAISRKNILHLAYWTAAWVLTLAVVAFGIKYWDFSTALSLMAIILNAIVGAGMILMNRKYNNGLDEMQRKVAMDAKAIALGVGVVGGLSYEMLDAANVIPFDAEIGHLVMLIGFTYFVAIIVGSLRYK